MILGPTNNGDESHIDKAMPLYSKQPFISPFCALLACRPSRAHTTECRGARTKRNSLARTLHTSGHQSDSQDGSAWHLPAHSQVAIWRNLMMHSINVCITNINNRIVDHTAYSRSIWMELCILKWKQSWIQLTYVISIHSRLPSSIVGASAVCAGLRIDDAKLKSNTLIWLVWFVLKNTYRHVIIGVPLVRACVKLTRGMSYLFIASALSCAS